jgi:hypothetical protein
LGYGDMNARDARPAAAPLSGAKKAGGWFKKITGL